MVTTILGITAGVLAIAAGYFAFRSSKINDLFLDQKVKFESVINYSKTLEEKLTSQKTTKATNSDAVKTGKAIKLAEAPKKRGRKPSSK